MALPEALLVVKVNHEAALVLYDDGMVVAPGEAERDEVRGLLVEALAIITPMVPRGPVNAEIGVRPYTPGPGETFHTIAEENSVNLRLIEK